MKKVEPVKAERHHQQLQRVRRENVFLVRSLDQVRVKAEKPSPCDVWTPMTKRDHKNRAVTSHDVCDEKVGAIPPHCAFELSVNLVEEKPSGERIAVLKIEALSRFSDYVHSEIAAFYKVGTTSPLVVENGAVQFFDYGLGVFFDPVPETFTDAKKKRTNHPANPSHCVLNFPLPSEEALHKITAVAIGKALHTLSEE